MTRLAALAIALAPISASAAVSFVAAGTESAVTAANCAPDVPAGNAQNDILIVVNHSRTNTAHTCATNCTGWAEMATQAGDATGGRLSVWWLRRGVSAPAAPTFGGPATESHACRMWAFRGAKTTGNPWNVIGSVTAEASAATYTGDVLVTTVDGSMMVFVGGSMDNDAWGASGGSCTNPTASDTACTAQNLCCDNGSGTDDSVFLAYDATPEAQGSQPACTNAKSLASDPGYSLSLALEPEPGPACTDYSMMGFSGCF